MTSKARNDYSHPTVSAPKDAPSVDSGEKTAMMKGDPETIRAERERAAQQPACLIVVRGTPQGHRYFITQDKTILGRDPTADIVVQDANVSRKHAALIRKGDTIALVDEGSSNGTKVNGKTCEVGKPVNLAKEDMIGMGTTQFKFLPAGELETLYYGNLGDAANMDAMTGIYNKGFFLQAIEVEFKRHKALHSDFSVVFFDLDHFKKVNDNFGHDAGDYVLKEVTRLIVTSGLRPKDVFARYGGEEFVILMGNASAEQARIQAEKIRQLIENHFFNYDDKRIPVTLSMGVAALDSQVESAQTLLRSADKALYAAKQGGRNRVMVASH